MKYFLPTHCDAGNRGCEAITKATSIILKIPSTDLLILSKDPKEDVKFELGKISTIHKLKEISTFVWQIIKIKHKFTKNIYKRKSYIYSAQYDNFLDRMKKEDILLSTGGDMFCYDDNEAVYTSSFAQKHGIKSILWGCSIGEENLDEEKIKILNNFDLIYVRESLSLKVLKNKRLNNVCLFPDPAFILEPEKIELPEFMKSSDLIGLNISNFVLNGFSLDTHFGKEITEVIDYIIEKTNLKIALFPHVLWKSQDDRIVSAQIFNKYKKTGRIWIFETEKNGYCAIRYAISKCRYFIGARTHAVISAYSTCVPTIAIGYSIKSIGIAKDLGLDNYLVVDSKNIRRNVLLNSFLLLIKNETDIKAHLQQIIPTYKNSVYDIKHKILEMYTKQRI